MIFRGRLVQSRALLTVHGHHGTMGSSVTRSGVRVAYHLILRHKNIMKPVFVLSQRRFVTNEIYLKCKPVSYTHLDVYKRQNQY